VPQAFIVLVAAPDLIPALKERMAAPGVEILAFSDAEVPRALDVIVTRQPGVVALERLFAATPRGAALINRIKADPGLAESEIRVVSHDSKYVRVSPRRPPPGARPAGGVATATTPAPPPVQALDKRGTRRAPRFKIAGLAGVIVEGQTATLVDLSTIGAQILSEIIVKPNQRVRIALTDDHGALRLNATVAWASFEIPPHSDPRYRAGIEFVDADGSAVDAYCKRHKA
jgi:hypothetical protein